MNAHISFDVHFASDITFCPIFSLLYVSETRIKIFPAVSCHFLPTGLVLEVPQFLLLIDGLELFDSPFGGRLGVVLAVAEFLPELDIPVFSFVPAEGFINSFAVLYFDDYH